MLNLKKITLALICLSTFSSFSSVYAGEPPSTVNAKYVDPSITKPLAENEKISHLYQRNQGNDFILQLLGNKTYFFQRHHYATTFVVGKNGVLVFDPLENQGPYILAAIKRVTDLPVTTIVYSHAHFDHIGDTKILVDQAKKEGMNVRIIASEKTADKLRYIQSKLPKPTEIIQWPNGKFKFENQTIVLHGFKHAAHSDDHAAWLLVESKVLHTADHMNPDQLPFWRFGGSETFLYYEDNLRETSKLNWKFMNAGHGNIGSHDDFTFYFKFLMDLKKSVNNAIQATSWGEGINPEKVNTHAAYLTGWYNAVTKKAVAELRPMYGKYYGFEYSTPSNAEMVTLSLTEYK